MLQGEKAEAGDNPGGDADDAGRGLRLVKSSEARPAPPAPDPELKAVLDDMKRRYRVQRERLDQGPDDKDAA